MLSSKDLDVSIVSITGHGAWTWQKGALSMENIFIYMWSELLIKKQILLYYTYTTSILGIIQWNIACQVYCIGGFFHEIVTWMTPISWILRYSYPVYNDMFTHGYIFPIGFVLRTFSLWNNYSCWLELVIIWKNQYELPDAFFRIQP